jgi:hypothetical protein
VTIATGASGPVVAHELRTRPPDALPKRVVERKVNVAATQPATVESATVAPAVVTSPTIERDAEDRHDGRSGATVDRAEAHDGAAAQPEPEAEDRSPSAGPGGGDTPAAVVVDEPDEHGGSPGVSGGGESGDAELDD